MAPPRNVVVVGASAGGVEALREFVSALPRDLPAAVLVVLHVAPGGTSVLPGILNRAGDLPAAPVGDGEPAEEGRIYVGIPDRHIVLEDGVLRAPRGPRENGHRPAVDPLFRSAAVAYGPSCTAVILSGSRDDGTAGAAAVRAAGGHVLVQHPDDALYPSMPECVIERVGADGMGTAAALAGLVAESMRDRAHGGAPMSGGDGVGNAARHDAGEPDASGLTCPECGGAVYLDRLEGVVQLSCHTGHAYSLESFAAEQERAVEGALWSAVRHLEERAALLRRLADGMPGAALASERFAAGAHETEGQAGAIRELIASRSAEPS